ncbi:MAG: hypothetical protein HC876_23585 [Chloroflexaceae bacterium]|nr:hypothetical protein [Chloroflexaceae bacterium]
MTIGWRYYCTLAPGDMLRLSERLFGSFSALVIDMRPARQLDIQSTLPTSDPLTEITVHAQVLYRVTNPRLVAYEVDDALAKFRDYIIGRLRREIARLAHHQISELFCERVIYEIGAVPQFGLTVEGINLLSVEHDEAVIDQLRKRRQLNDDQGINNEIEEMEHQKRLRQQYYEQELAYRQAQYSMLLESQQKMNSQMQDVLRKHLEKYPDADPEELREQIRATYAEVSERPRITFGSSSTIGQPTQRITFGKSTNSPSLPSSTTPPADDKDDDDDDNT